jgi:hypothetical protein
MLHRSRALAVLLLTALPLVGATGSSPRPVPVLVELFTSEGCSSCPPADELLAKLVREQPLRGVEIIGLGEHVDYWNGAEWSDRFSSREFSRRQGEYKRALGLPSQYTPQMVVDGSIEFVGSNGSRARDAIAQSAREAKRPLAIACKLRSATSAELSIDTPAGPGDGAALYAAIVEDNLSSQVAGGENHGEHLVHAAVVRSLVRVARSHSASVPIPIDRAWKRADLRAVVFLQDPKTLRILGSASAPLE